MRIGPRPTARVSATHHSSESQDRSSLANRTGMLDTGLPPQLHFGVYCGHAPHSPAPPALRRACLYCRELGMGSLHPIQAPGLWASRRKGTAASSQAGSITRACQQARPSNKSCGTKARVCCVGGAAEGGTLWSCGLVCFPVRKLVSTWRISRQGLNMGKSGWLQTDNPFSALKSSGNYRCHHSAWVLSTLW